MILFFSKTKRGLIILHELVHIYIGLNLITLEMSLHLCHDISNILLNL